MQCCTEIRFAGKFIEYGDKILKFVFSPQWDKPSSTDATVECGRERGKRPLFVLRHDMVLNTYLPLGPPVKTNKTDMEQNYPEKIGDIKILLFKQLRTLATNVEASRFKQLEPPLTPRKSSF